MQNFPFQKIVLSFEMKIAHVSYIGLKQMNGSKNQRVPHLL